MKEQDTLIFSGNCCSGPSISIPVMPREPVLAETYTPYQVYMGILPAMEGLRKGTIFHELHRPYSKASLANNQNPSIRVMPNNMTLPENYSPNVANRFEKNFETLINDRNIMGNVSPESYRSNPGK